MKLTYNQYNELLDNSQLFRQIVYTKITREPSLEQLKRVIVELCNANYDDKIRAIKCVRILSKFIGHQLLIDLFELPEKQLDSDPQLGLINAKKLIEKLYDFANRMPY